MGKGRIKRKGRGRNGDEEKGFEQSVAEGKKEKRQRRRERCERENNV